MTDHLEITFPATLRNAQLATIAARHIVRALYDQIHPDPADSLPDPEQYAADVEICVGEAVTNSVRHCLHPNPDTRVVCVTFAVDQDTHPQRLIITIRDQNEAYDFNSIPEPDFATCPEGGYGIFIMREKMARVTYCHKDNWNVLTLVRDL